MVVNQMKLTLNLLTFLQFIEKCGNYGIGGDYWTHMDENNVDPDPHANVFNNKEYPGKPIITLLNVLQAPEAGKSLGSGLKNRPPISI